MSDEQEPTPPPPPPIAALLNRTNAAPAGNAGTAAGKTLGERMDELAARVEHLEEQFGALDEAADARLEALEDRDGTLTELRAKLAAALAEIERLRLEGGGSPAAKLRGELAELRESLANERKALDGWLADAETLGWDGEEAFVDWVRAKIRKGGGRPPGRPRGSSSRRKAKRRPE